MEIKLKGMLGSFLPPPPCAIEIFEENLVIIQTGRNKSEIHFHNRKLASIRIFFLLEQNIFHTF